jgi:hypothetical protein
MEVTESNKLTGYNQTELIAAIKESLIVKSLPPFFILWLINYQNYFFLALTPLNIFGTLSLSQKILWEFSSILK